MKKIISLILVLVIVLTACGGGGSTEDEVVTINWLIPGQEQADEALVEDAINEILVPEIGAKLDIQMIAGPEYNQNVSLKLSAGEELDIVFAANWILDFNSQVSSGAYYDLTDLVSASSIKDSITQEFWDGVTVDDKIYAVPTDKELSTSRFALFPKDVVEEYGWDTSTATDLVSSLEFASKYTEETGDVGYYASWQSSFGPYMSYDCLGEMKMQICLDPKDPDGKYEWVFDKSEYVDVAEKVGEITESGAIEQDPTQAPDYALLDYGVTLSEGTTLSLPIWEGTFEKTFEQMEISEAVVTSNSVRGSLNAIATSSKNPEKAFKVLEMINTNAEVRNLLAYGIEGTHYTLTDDGKVSQTEEASNYTPGVYTQGDYEQLLLREGEPDNAKELLQEYNESAVVSPALGFAPDLSAYSAEVANVLNIIEKNKSQIISLDYSGSLDEVIESNRAEFESVGFFDIIDEINKQYEEWKNNQ